MNRQPTKTSPRSQSGANQMEFAAVFVVLIVFVLVPLCSLCAIPIRMAFANAAVRDTVRYLAMSERYSLAFSTLASGTLLQPRLAVITGVKLKKADLSLVANNKGGATQTFTGGKIPEDWLPNGKAAPYHYNLILNCEMEISPLFLIGADLGIQVPGLTEPFDTHMTESCAWENLSQDPNTKEFYMNE